MLCILRVCCRQWLPESPRFDIARGMPDRAMATLERVARENGKPMPLGKLVDVVAEVCLCVHLLHCLGVSVAVWLACWTQAQKGLGSNRSRDAVT